LALALSDDGSLTVALSCVRSEGECGLWSTTAAKRATACPTSQILSGGYSPISLVADGNAGEAMTFWPGESSEGLDVSVRQSGQSSFGEPSALTSAQTTESALLANLNGELLVASRHRSPALPRMNAQSRPIQEIAITSVPNSKFREPQRLQVPLRLRASIPAETPSCFGTAHAP